MTHTEKQDGWTRTVISDKFTLSYQGIQEIKPWEVRRLAEPDHPLHGKPLVIVTEEDTVEFWVLASENDYATLEAYLATNREHDGSVVALVKVLESHAVIHW